MDTRPVPFTLGRWIELTRAINRHTERVILYRETGDGRIKDGLPRATVGAVCQGGRRMEHIVRRTGWIAIDADAADNNVQGVELRTLIGRVDCVAYVGLSASGKGAWGLVKVSDPERQAEHFEQLRADFETIGVKLDASKGKNPNDCRSISYDPDGIYRRDFRTYTRLPMPKPKLRRRPRLIASQRGANAYAGAALDGELDELSRTAEGSRNHRLFVAAASLGGLVGAGLLNERVVTVQLQAVALGIGLDPREAAGTIRSGLRRGKENPRLLSPRA